MTCSINHIHSADIKQIVVKIKKKIKCLIHFDPDARVFDISNWHKIQLLWQIFSSNLICLTPFSQLWLGLIDCMILMKEYVSLTAAAMKMGKIYFDSDQSNGC